MNSQHPFYQRNWDLENPKGVVLLIHGLGEHSGRYQPLGNHLNQHGYVMSAIDLPGHGKSPGTPGHIDQFSGFSDAVLLLLNNIKSQYHDRPIFLLGHSMGGLIASQILLDHQSAFKGAMLSGAAIDSPQKPPAWQAFVVKILAKLFPRLALIKLDTSGLCSDPAVLENYLNDPLVNTGKLSARFLSEMSNAMDNSKIRAANITLPIFIMHGGSDVITAPEGSVYLYENISSADKQLSIYDGLLHEIFNEPEAPTIYAEIIDWLNNRC